MEQITLSNGWKVLAFQDLPAPQVATWMMMTAGRGPKEVYTMELFGNAAGAQVEDEIVNMTFRELQKISAEWLAMSFSIEPVGEEIDWDLEV